MTTIFISSLNSGVATPSPVQLTGNAILSDYITFNGIKSFSAVGVPTYNTSLAFVGTDSGRLNYPIPTGSSLVFAFQRGERQSLANFWINTSSGDGVFCVAY